jgi:preprotein translocase subunit SecG
MYAILLTFHIVASIALILIVLLQSGKGGGIAGLFGGGGADQLMGAPSGLAFIKKVTVVAAVIFMLTSLTLTIVSNRMGVRSVTESIPNIPAAPVAPPAPAGQ